MYIYTIIQTSAEGKQQKPERARIMKEQYKAMANSMAIKIRVIKISAGHYENRRNCPFVSELKGMEMALNTLGIPYEYDFNDDCQITAVTVGGETVAI